MHSILDCISCLFSSCCFFPFEASCASKTTTKSSTSYVLNFFNCGSCIAPFCFSVVSRSSKSSSLSSGSSSSVVSVSQNGNYALISVTRCVIKLLHPCINCKLEQKKSLRELEIVVNGESFLHQLKDFYFLSLQLDELEGFGLKMLLNLKFYSRFLEAGFVSDLFSCSMIFVKQELTSC